MSKAKHVGAQECGDDLQLSMKGRNIDPISTDPDVFRNGIFPTPRGTRLS